MKKKDWFRLKKYPHFGMPLAQADRNWVEEYLSDGHKVATHAFLPFIHRSMLVRRFRKTYDSDTDLLQDLGKRRAESKLREIYYASHLDSNVFSYYAHILSRNYEIELANRDLDRCITAYRQIGHPTKNRGMNNVDFAEEVFSFIRKSAGEVLVATTYDISSFFDSLNHQILKKAWARTLGRSVLPADHYNVFKAITRFSYVDISELFEAQKYSLIARNSLGGLKTVSVDRLEHLRNKDVISFCLKRDFAAKIRSNGMIKSNKFVKKEDGKIIKREFGIPQGSPISAMLANLYLLEFDSTIAGAIRQCDGLYRRYSDDIVTVTPESSAQKIYDLVLAEISKLKLGIQKKKTASFQFEKVNCSRRCLKINPNGDFNDRKRFQYLGFEFDGEFVYMKSSSLAKFYRKMKHAVNRGAFFAKCSSDEESRGQIFRRRLYKKYSYLGAKRRMLWRRSTKTGKWHRQYCHNWGNFITYAFMAQYNMVECKARQQIRNHWVKLNQYIRLKEI